MRVDNNTGKGTSGMNKVSDEVHRVHMELEGKLLKSLRIKIQFLERLQRVIVVDSATHSQKDGVEGDRGYLEDRAEALCCSCAALSWFCGVLSSQYLTLMR